MSRSIHHSVVTMTISKHNNKSTIPRFYVFKNILNNLFFLSAQKGKLPSYISPIIIQTNKKKKKSLLDVYPIRWHNNNPSCNQYHTYHTISDTEINTTFFFVVSSTLRHHKNNISVRMSDTIWWVIHYKNQQKIIIRFHQNRRILFAVSQEREITAEKKKELVDVLNTACLGVGQMLR